LREARMRTRHGFTLLELLLALVVMVTVLGGALSFLVSQSRMFRRGGDAMAVLQNLSFGADNLHSQLRTAGANTADDQPPVVYAGPNAFAFNADYVSNDRADFSAVYIDPDAPSEQVEGLLAARQIEIPGSTPAFMYPAVDYGNDGGINTPAETIVLFFTPDGETARGDDFLLMRQVNDQPPEVLIRRVLRDSVDLPFFRYYKQRVPPGNGQVPVLSLLPPAELPLAHGVPIHGTAGDAASAIDSLRAVLVS
jgi:prepilin-type N-terminal cleavage/methylation domain-containing protein